MSEIYESLERARTVERRASIEKMVAACTEQSVTSAADAGRTVERPASAARYATNALLFHETKLLAAAAVTFARGEVEALLAGEATDE